MQVTLNQAEIEVALKGYIVDQGISITGRQVSVSLIAGRGANGMSAVIDVTNGLIGEVTVSDIVPPVSSEDALEATESNEDGQSTEAALFGH